MFTVCSKCNLRLTVTAMDLRAAQGYVRCGRCHNVFNALAALADDPARQAEPAASADTQRRPVLTQPEPPLPDPPPPPATAVVDDAGCDASLEFNPASTNISEVFIEAEAADRSGTFESIVLSGEEPAPIPAAADPVIAPQALSAPVAPTPPDQSVNVNVDVQHMRDALAEPALVSPATTNEALGLEPAPEPVAPEARVFAAGVPAAAPISGDLFDDWTATRSAAAGAAINATAAAEIAGAIDAAQAERPLEDAYTEAPETQLLKPAQRPPRLRGWATGMLAVALTLCLVAQLVHHYRNALATTALLRGPLTTLYQTLGMPLAERWNVADYEVRQLGATTDGAAAGELVVRASISNRAPRDQPLPLLRVVMQDRFGNRVAGRDLKPAEYLGPTAPQVSLMAPGQRVDVQVAFQDPGQAATGFEIDACMPRPDHSVTCANDPGNH